MTATCTMGCEGAPRWDDELGDFCPVCQAEQAAYVATLGRPPRNQGPQPGSREYAEQMVDAGRGPLLRDGERW